MADKKRNDDKAQHDRGQSSGNQQRKDDGRRGVEESIQKHITKDTLPPPPPPSVKSKG